MLAFLIFGLGIYVGVLAYPVYLDGFNLDTLSKLSDIALMIFAGVGLNQLVIAKRDLGLKKKKESREFIISQINFFKKEILNGSASKLIQAIKEKSLPIPSLLKIDTLSKDAIKNLNPEDLKRAQDQYRNLSKYEDIKIKIVELLNDLEEFSINIVSSDHIKHPALESIKKPFVELIQANVFHLIFQIDILQNYYSHLVKVYDEWKGGVEIRQKMMEDKISEIVRNSQIIKPEQ